MKEHQTTYSTKKNIPTRPEDIRFADDTEILKRRSAFNAFKRFVVKYFEPGLGLIFVSDEANMLDITCEDIPDIIAKIHQLYGVKIDEAKIRQPVWKLLDILEPSSGR